MTEPTANERRAEEERDTLAELADTIERIWLTRWGRVPVVAAFVIERIRRGW